MNESRWRTSSDPGAMLESLRGKASARKLRLFACASVAELFVWLDDRASREALLVAERFADGKATREQLDAALLLGWKHGFEGVRCAFASAVKGPAEGLPDRVRSLVHAVVGRAVRSDYAAYKAGRPCSGLPWRECWAAFQQGQADCLREVFGNPFRPPAVDPAWLAWEGGTVAKLARVIYEERDLRRLSVLADALEDAGCEDAPLLSHLRGPGPHVRGCWALDLILGKG